MIFQESDKLELKEEYTDDIRKEIIAFANTNGGILYVGVNDNGEVIGLSDPDQVALRISNCTRDAICPDISMFMCYTVLEVENKKILKVEIQRGDGRPYYLASKGLRPAGVYVRQASSSAPASETAIRRMIKETDGDEFESMRSLNQELTFEEASKVFNDARVPFGKDNQRTLGMINSDGMFTNLALLLSDQCPHIIKAAMFRGCTAGQMRDRKDFGGSLLKQVEDAYQYLNLQNQTRSKFEGVRRIDHRDYQESTIREALLNAIVHRDYSNLASILISVYNDRIEFISYGGLAGDVLLSDILNGLSVCRNRQLANVFYRLNLIEAYGTGIRKIKDAYEGKDSEAKFLATPNSFKVVLPNLNYLTDVTTDDKVNPEEEMVLRLIDDDGSVSRNTVQNKLGISASSAVRLLNGMKDFGLIKTIGKGKNLRYIIR